MFTGLIQDIGTVKTIIDEGANKRLTIQTALDMSRHALGASIACSGICLTVIEKGADWFAVDISPETLARTCAKNWQAGQKINLEPSLRLGDEMGGHIVSGHVDGLAQIQSIEDMKGSFRIEIMPPADLMRFIAEKGSVALNGISLTVNSIQKHSFSVMIIPHSWVNTDLSALKSGDFMHIEIDMLARYIGRMMEFRTAP
jgi:riboflavin synthase